jgi:aminoglycoside phosphotransferase (APT) family kinase protein
MTGACSEAARRGEEADGGGGGAAPARGAGLPLATPSERRLLFERLVDSERMREVLGRELPRLTDEPIRVTGCKAKPRRRRSSFEEGRLEVVYKVGVEHGCGGGREYVLLGTAPESAGFLQAEEERSRALRGHPAVVPFRRTAAYVDELRLALRFFPFDPALPALAELTGPGGALLLSPYLGECRAGATVERAEWELRQYKPFKRAVLRITASFAEPRVRPHSLYAKLFGDDRGARFHAELSALWSAARGARSLRMPEPLGYDAGRRMLLLGEAAGPHHLIDWIKGLENDGALPPDVDFARAERCMAVAADALAELQRSGLRPEGRRSFAGELGRLEKERRVLRGPSCRQHPELVRAAEELVQRLEALAPLHEELLPAHGGFRHKQTVGDEDSLTVIDWDGLCLADPALDAATFLLRLRQEPLREPGSAPEMERLAETFRREFLARRPEVPPDRLALYEALVLTEGMLRSFRRATRDEEMPGRIRNLAAAAREALDRALAGRGA